MALSDYLSQGFIMKYVLLILFVICSVINASEADQPSSQRRLFASNAPTRGLSFKKEQAGQCAQAMASILTRMEKSAQTNPQDLTDEAVAQITEDLGKMARNIELCRRWGVIPASETEEKLKARIAQLESQQTKQAQTSEYVRPPLTSSDHPLWTCTAGVAGGAIVGAAAVLGYLKR